MRRATPLAAVVLLATFPFAPAAADPGGGDAPDEWWKALLLEPGSYNATLAEDAPPGWTHYDEDWYRTAIPSGTYVRLTLSATGPVTAYLRAIGETASSRRVSDRQFEVAAGENETATVVLTEQVTAGWFRFGLRGYARAVNYTFDIEAVPAPDYEVWPVTITDLPIEPRTDGAPRIVRRIDFDVTNHGPGAGEGNVTVALRTPTDGRTTHLATFTGVALEPGERRNFSVDWDVVATGTIGQADVLVMAHVPFDHFEGNNGGAWGYRGGPGFHWSGVTLWPYHQSCRHLDAWWYVCLKAESRPHESGTVVEQNARGGSFVGRQQAHAFVVPHVTGANFVLASVVAYSLVEVQRYEAGGGFVHACPPVGRCAFATLP